MKDRPQRIGLMVPMNNTTLEPELKAWLPTGSICVTQRIPRGKGTLTPDDLPQYVAQAMTLAERYASDDIDLVVYGCTAAGFMMGPVRDAGIAALARATMPESCDAMFIACSQLPTREILVGLERDFGRPVWSSIRATAWQATRESAAFSAGG
ncbi:MAG: hypothetical protein ACT4PS_18615 [Betaproteobacteria bacterium]